MLYLFLFLVELFLLFFLSKKLINALARIIFKITKSHRIVVNVLSIIFLPGTIFHELSHLLTAGLLLVPVGEISVLPELEEKGVKLGSVAIGRSDPIRRMFIGVAPVLLGLLTIFGLLYFIKISNDFLWWQILLSLYLIFQIGNTMFASKKDLEGTIGFVLAGLIVTILALGGLYFINLTIFQNLMTFLSSIDLNPLFNLFKTALFYLLVPLILDLMVILLTKLYPKEVLSF